MKKRTQPQPQAQVSLEEVQVSSLRVLEQRLDDGYRRIESGQLLGEDITQWEEFWIDLLHQYEQLTDQAEDSSTWAAAA